MIAPQPRPPGGQLDAAVQALTMQVNRDTVLQARAALLSEALRLSDALTLHGAGIAVGRCGSDPVSSDAATAFSKRITELLTCCSQHVSNLEHAGTQLEAIARSYGYTEGEIIASFTT